LVKPGEDSFQWVLRFRLRVLDVFRLGTAIFDSSFSALLIAKGAKRIPSRIGIGGTVARLMIQVCSASRAEPFAVLAACNEHWNINHEVLLNDGAEVDLMLANRNYNVFRFAVLSGLTLVMTTTPNNGDKVRIHRHLNCFEASVAACGVVAVDRAVQITGAAGLTVVNLHVATHGCIRTESVYEPDVMPIAKTAASFVKFA